MRGERKSWCWNIYDRRWWDEEIRKRRFLYYPFKGITVLLIHPPPSSPPPLHLSYPFLPLLRTSFLPNIENPSFSSFTQSCVWCTNLLTKVINHQHHQVEGQATSSGNIWITEHHHNNEYLLIIQRNGFWWVSKNDDSKKRAKSSFVLLTDPYYEHQKLHSPTLSNNNLRAIELFQGINIGCQSTGFCSYFQITPSPITIYAPCLSSPFKH